MNKRIRLVKVIFSPQKYLFMCKSLRKAMLSLLRGIAQIMLFTHFQVFRSDPDVFGFNRIVFNLTPVTYSTM